MLYVCLITAPGHAVETAHVLDRSSDGAASDAAMSLARDHSAWHGYELWRDGRKLAAFFPPSVMSALGGSTAIARRLS